MRRARRLYASNPAPLELNGDLFALGATLIVLSLALFPCARCQSTQAAVKLNVLLDLGRPAGLQSARGRPARNRLARRDPGVSLRLHRLHLAAVSFVTRLKTNTCFYVVESRPVVESTGLRLRSNDPARPETKLWFAVESRSARWRRSRSVSTQRPSNQTCGFPASGFRNKVDSALAHGRFAVVMVSRTRPSA